MRTESPVPSSVQKSIAFGRYGEAAAALARLAVDRPSPPILLALAAVDLQLGHLADAKQHVLKVVEAAPGHVEARALLARIRAALDERSAALDDFSAVVELSSPTAEDAAGTPVHLALHNLEQLDYLERLHGLSAGTLLPMSAAEREQMRRRFNQILDTAGTVTPRVKLDGAGGRALAEPPRMRRNEPPPARVLGLRNDGAAVAQTFRDGGGVACIDDLLSSAALAQLQRFCLESTVWRRSYRRGYLGAYPESGFVSPLLLQLAAELKAALPELLGEHHLTYWWSFVCQHQRPGTDIHADQSDISLNFWITPDQANLAPGSGGLEMWNVAAPTDWSFNDYNADSTRIRVHLSQLGARQTSFAYAENRGLLFHGMLFHQTASCRFAEGFENRRRNITMLFRRSRSR
ncbi:MAG: tetratricopeptide repeat protein [Reyranella sp.]|uniref:tetratricopeptide repeat protein n=1 Tax=Reyranella sp. TaxID=1929291 RepID=UPI001AC18200|nr:tetratricopeptide repeat protein [Reyranella sp.]MBN9088775.1 tetratricopeptide repeat protein [Reyranella sp.]